MLMNKDEWQKRIAKIPQAMQDFKLLILFGSRARGEHKPDSDWDFAVLYEERSAQKDISSLLKIYTLLEQALEIPEDKIDVVDLKECSPILAHYVARDGRGLF